ncbi:MAG TPA: hypothetical protein DDX98_00105 [Bacteroidales bacterium]|nr:hypothetical protein [Bacteroidales bacterium]
MKILGLIISFLLLAHACEKENGGNNNTSDNYISLSLNLNDKKQQIQSFGASDAWSIQFVGKNWPLEKREQIAELLFSTDTDENQNPKGIGLSGWRFNIGGGSAEQGVASEIGDEWRRAECFLNPDGTYNWSKQAGQRWFLKSATAYGVNHITAFVNSPPVHYTKNGKAWSGGGNSTNLSGENYSAFAQFLATVIDEVETREQVGIDYVSPVNEPQWDWDNKGQEGSPYTNSEIADVTKRLSSQLINKGLDTKIELADAAHISYIYQYGDKPERGNQAFEFFSTDSDNYIGDLPNVAHKISGHSYYSTYPPDNMIDQRQQLANGILAVDPNLEFWQSEYCILEGNDEINGNGRDLGINSALYLARLMHYDLTVANSSTWYWWLAVSPYDYKDGLVYIDKNKTNGNLTDSKLLWAMGNFSRFIRPGMGRYNVIRSDNNLNESVYSGLMVSGYAPEDQSQGIFVLVNYSETVNYPVKVKTIDNRIPKSVKSYITSAKSADNLRFADISNADEVITIPARSVVTIILDF